jgi:hypothetical protein
MVSLLNARVGLRFSLMFRPLGFRFCYPFLIAQSRNSFWFNRVHSFSYGELNLLRASVSPLFLVKDFDWSGIAAFSFLSYSEEPCYQFCVYRKCTFLLAYDYSLFASYFHQFPGFALFCYCRSSNSTLLFCFDYSLQKLFLLLTHFLFRRLESYHEN